MAAEGTGQHVPAHSKFKNMDIFVPYLWAKTIETIFESLDQSYQIFIKSKSGANILKGDS